MLEAGLEPYSRRVQHDLLAECRNDPVRAAVGDDANASRSNSERLVGEAPVRRSGCPETIFAALWPDRMSVWTAPT